MTPDLALSAMLGLVPWVGDRHLSRDERAAMLQEQAVAFVSVAKNERQLAFLIAYAWEDTKLASHIVYGHCERMPKKGERCDNGHARGVLSVHSWCHEAWSLPAGSPESMVAEARCALHAAYGGVARCREHSLSPVHAMFVGVVGVGVPCTWKPAHERVKTYRRVLASLRRQQ